MKLQKLVKKIKAHKIYALLVIVALLLLGFMAWNKYSAWQNKKSFEQADKNIDELYSYIVSQVGKPDASKKTKDCSRPNLEFEQGPLSCHLSRAFIYPVSDINEANSKFKRVQESISNRQDIFKSRGDISDSLTERLAGDSNYTSAIDHYSTGGSMECTAKYIYDTPLEMDLKIINRSKKSLEVYITCSDWAKSEYYPINSI